MAHTDFVHLRVHSAYSLSEGAIKADKIATLARDAGMPAVGIADTNNLFGALEFSQACASRGVQPIVGCQISLDGDPVVVIAQNDIGFANLQRLSSSCFLDTTAGNAPQVDEMRLFSLADGLILLTGGTRGPLFRLLAEGRAKDAEAWLSRIAEAFPDRTVVELHRHGLASEKDIEPGMIAVADRLGLPLAATNECFFAKPAMYEAHDALLCIAEGRTLAETNRRRVTPEHWFKPAAQMRALFADLPEACDNTLAIAKRCAVMATTRKPLLPVCPKVRPGSTEDETLRAMAREGLEARLAAMAVGTEKTKEYRDRLEFELEVISRMGFPGYFLIVADFIQWAKSQDIPVGPGRGSGAGSLAAWALTITDLDPIRFGLLFERFLNPERISMPDFDIDFCQDRRDEVIAYVRREYGDERVAQIITFGKLQARAAVRDVGRVLGLPFGQTNKVAELIPNNPAKPVTLQEAIDGEPKLREMREQSEEIKRLLEIALQIEGLYRHASTHAAGVVIGDRPLVELVPLYKDTKSNDLVTQYSLKYVEQAGLVKFDFLGLTTLTILQRAVRMLAELGINIDLARLPLDDRATYDMLAKGDAGGVFQFESQGMRDVLRQMRPDRLEDLIAANALYRPGPMVNIPAYCQRKHGEAWESPHPSIRDILEETYGIMVYQEQVMQIAQRMAGYSLSAADQLRRAMGKKIRAEMDAQRQVFQEGAVKNGIDPAKAAEVFDLMAKFADYGFNKSHAAAYGLVAYQTAWMKANHPVAFIAACMDLAIGNTDKLAVLRQEARLIGIEVLPADINKSRARFSIDRGDDGKLAIRYALAAIRKVGEGAMLSLERVRAATPFRSLADFAARIDPRHVGKMQIENLARAGAFDSLDKRRARIFASSETIARRAQALAEDTASGQIGLFGQGVRDDTLRLADATEWSDLEKLGEEADAVGFHLTSHPLEAYETVLRRQGVVRSNQLQTRAEAGGGRVKLAGTVINMKERPTRTGSRMAWVRLSDPSGSYEVTLFAEVLSKARELLREGNSVMISADLRLEGEALRVTGQDVTSLESVAARSGAELRVWLAATEAVPHIKNLLEREKGRGRVVLLPTLPEERAVEIALPGLYHVTPRLAQAIRVVPGVVRAEES